MTDAHAVKLWLLFSLFAALWALSVGDQGERVADGGAVRDALPAEIAAVTPLALAGAVTGVAAAAPAPSASMASAITPAPGGVPAAAVPGAPRFGEVSMLPAKRVRAQRRGSARCSRQAFGVVCSGL